MSTDLAFWSATDLLRGYRAGTVSPVEATRAALDQVSKLDEAVNAFVMIDEEKALASARESEARWKAGAPEGLLDGVPTTIKDLSTTIGWPTLRGSNTVSDEGPWDEETPYVARLREHSAVFIGKTTTPEYGWKGITDSPRTGVTRNPWDTSKTPGGSSGGAAVACALGMGALHQGSDGGGSIRMPCGYTGIYGIKPTFGRVPAYPASLFGTLSHCGPMTRTVADSALMLTVMAEPDPRDWYSLPYAGDDWRRSLSENLSGMRIAYSPDLGVAKVDPEIAELVKTAVGFFTEFGAVVEEVDPGLGSLREEFRVHWYAGAANLGRTLSDDQKALLDPGLRQIAEEGSEISLAAYQEAVKGREAAGLKMGLFHQRYDLLLTPTLPIPAFEAGEEVPVGSGMERWFDWTPFSYPFNLTRQPAATIPCGRTSAGLPAGLQIVGALGREDLVFAASAAYEAVRPVDLPPMAHA